MNFTYKGRIYEWAFNNFEEWFQDFVENKPYSEWRICQDIDAKIIENLTRYRSWERRFLSIWSLVKRLKKNATEKENIILSPIHIKLSYLKERCDRRFPK